ncbi:MAG: hypothetical protein ACR65R_00170 [Methylomicrobium sp.]
MTLEQIEKTQQWLDQVNAVIDSMPKLNDEMKIHSFLIVELAGALCDLYSAKKIFDDAIWSASQNPCDPDSDHHSSSTDSTGLALSPAQPVEVVGQGATASCDPDSYRRRSINKCSFCGGSGCCPDCSDVDFPDFGEFHCSTCRDTGECPNCQD